MSHLRCTLLSDGSSDRALLPLLDWVLRQQLSGWDVESAWADLRWLPHPPRGLSERIRVSLDLYPCDLLFVHRDAETAAPGHRVEEINRAVAAVRDEERVPTVCVVPIRMQEAWLLFDKAALRHAAGNPNGKQPLKLPPLRELERLPDPKNVLHELLRTASELHGRRLAKFSPAAGAIQVAEFLDDFAPLRALSAFRALETDVQQVLEENGWV